MTEPRLIKIEAVDELEICAPAKKDTSPEVPSGFNPVRFFQRRLKTRPHAADQATGGGSAFG